MVETVCRRLRAVPSRLILVGALSATALQATASAEAIAPSPVSPHVQPDRTRRVRVEFSVWGRVSQSDRSTLVSLLKQELSANGLLLVPTSSVPDSEGGLSVPGDAPLTLMRVALDVRSAAVWRILIVEVARERTLVRTLRAPAQNAAALEATVSIVAAAGVALHQGFEITPNPRPAPVPARAPQLSQFSTPPRPPTPLQVFSTLGVSLVTFESHVPLQLGPTAAIGLRWREQIALRLSASHFFAERFESAFGSFELDRSGLALGGGPIWSNGEFEGELSLGPAAELLRRRNATPAVGVTVRPSSDAFRAGAEAAARVRYRLVGSLGLELSASVAYFPTSLRFSADSGTDSVLAAPFKLVGLGGACLELRAP